MLPPRIVMTDLGLKLPLSFRGIQLLNKYDNEGLIRVEQVPVSEFECDYSGRILASPVKAFIHRPWNTEGRLKEHHFCRCDERIIIARLGKGVSHLPEIGRKFSNNIAPDDTCSNADATARWTVQAAQLIERPIDRCPDTICNRTHDPMPFSMANASFAGKTWGVVGSGAIPRALVRHLLPMDLSRLVFFHHSMTEDYFREMLDQWGIAAQIQREKGGFEVILNASPLANQFPLLIRGTSDLRELFRSGDFISIHLPHSRDSSGGRIVTHEIVNSELLNQIPHGRCPLVIFASRYFVMNANDVADAARSGHIRVALDLMHPDDEQFNSSQLCCPIAQLLSDSGPSLGIGDEFEPRLFQSPHIAGTDFRTLDTGLFSLVSQLFDRLGFAGPYDNDQLNVDLNHRSGSLRAPQSRPKPDRGVSPQEDADGDLP